MPSSCQSVPHKYLWGEICTSQYEDASIETTPRNRWEKDQAVTVPNVQNVDCVKVPQGATTPKAVERCEHVRIHIFHQTQWETCFESHGYLYIRCAWGFRRCEARHVDWVGQRILYHRGCADENPLSGMAFNH